MTTRPPESTSRESVQERNARVRLDYRREVVEIVAQVLASGGPVDEESEAAEQVVDALVTYLRPNYAGPRPAPVQLSLDATSSGSERP